MHPCFQVPEIVRLIVHGVWDGNEPSVDVSRESSLRPIYTALARLAQTCRSFHPHALDALWSCQSGIENLLHCMPTSLVAERRQSRGPQFQGKKNMLCFIRPLEPTDWNNFDSYARRIKILKLTSEVDPIGLYHRPAAAPTVYRDLAMCSHHSRPYFPNLSHLTCEMPELSSDILSFCATLLGPSLRVLSVHGNHEDMISVPFLLSYSLRLSPSLQQLQLTVGPSPDCLPLLDALGSFDQLHTLSLAFHEAPPIELWEALSAAPSLATLTLKVAPSWTGLSEPLTFSLRPDNPLNLNQITRLTLHDVDVADCLRVLACCSLASLVGVHFTVGFVNTTSDGPALIEAIVAVCPVSLRGLSLMSDPGIPANQLSSLRTFRGLIDLELTLSSGINDSMIEVVARTWPNLRKLALMYPRAKRPRPNDGITPDSLTHLIRRCPQLRQLSLHVDLRLVVITTQRSWSDVTNTYIKTLDVGSSLVGKTPTPSAAFLTDLFPNLATIHEHGSPPSGRWAEVAQLVSDLGIIRAQERQKQRCM
ncbi:hypothetical protein DAEQUDRAFT_125588 [Daedalea quercina L-15889]|uniref:F-box domain-containing protein n=1 Tax=Daedalea quercina L-15889 TaxID=1314783 RepID=A0A165RZ92_9APHY|nr:hypothetical protein DAEQUDRAFT_125588 [Daedalea quercina L-15889]